MRYDNKVFLIGLNKTGTTSMETYFNLLGYSVCPQEKYEKLFSNIIIHAELEIINEQHCEDLFALIEQYNFFQDIPFSIPYFYNILINKYPNNKFIFTTRKNAEIWVNSLTNVHTITFGKKNIDKHIYITDIYNILIPYLFKSMGFKDNENWYDKDKLISFYNKYINDVLNDFINSKNFVTINIDNSNKQTQEIIHNFLDIPLTYDIHFPHLMNYSSK